LRENIVLYSISVFGIMLIRKKKRMVLTMATKAHLERNKRYKQTQDQIVLTVPKGARDEIKAFAAEKGQSMNGYIIDLIEKDIGETVRTLADRHNDSDQEETE